MKILLFLITLMTTIPSFSQVITCNDSGCVPNSIPAVVQEKAGYSAVDIGLNSNETFSVVTGTGSTTKDLRLSLLNGEFPGKSMNVDLSSNGNGKNAGNIIVIGDNIDTLNVSLNGYSGLSGQDASQICATRILGGLYGNDVRVRFLQRRSSPSSGLTNDRCAQVDVDDIATNKFTCNDTTYNSLDTVDPKVNVTRVRQNSKCMGIAPQNVCLQKKYSLACTYKVATRNPDSGNFEFWDSTKAWTQNLRCDTGGACGSFPPCVGNSYFKKNGTVVWQNGIGTSEYYQFSKTYFLNSQELYSYQLMANGGDLCQTMVDNDPEWKPSSNNYEAYFYYNGKYNYCGGTFSCNEGCRMSSVVKSASLNSSGIKWVSIVQASPQETTPGLNSTLDGLSGGLGFAPSPNGNGALRDINYVNNAQICQGPVGRLPDNYVGGGGKTCTYVVGWQFELMPAFYPKGTFDENRSACNPYFSLITTKTENMVKTIYDPNTFTNSSTFCIDRNNPSNCSINPPYCDDPTSSVNCRKVSACEQINKKYCLDPANPTNCTYPPFCDNASNPANCSTSNLASSCESGGAADNNFCQKDANNIATYQFIGTEPDPAKNTESVDCHINNCPTQYKTLESASYLDTITPTGGQNGTLPGQGLFFVYDIRSFTSSAIPGQAGIGGKSDITSSSQNRYCGAKRDFTTDPNTNFENSPEVTFKKIIWKAFDIKGGGSPGQFPPFTNKKVEVYKKIDSSARYLLKKELL